MNVAETFIQKSQIEETYDIFVQKKYLNYVRELVLVNKKV